MSKHKVVMIVRSSNYEELMKELTDIDFDAMGVRIEIMDDEFFDSYIGVVAERKCHEG